MKTYIIEARNDKGETVFRVVENFRSMGAAFVHAAYRWGEDPFITEWTFTEKEIPYSISKKGARL